MAVLLLLTACATPMSKMDTSAEVSPSATVTSPAVATATLSKKDYLPTYQAKMTLWATEVSPTTIQTPTPLFSATPTFIRTATLTGTPTLKPDFSVPAATNTPSAWAVCPPANADMVFDEGIFERLHEIYPNAGQETYENHLLDMPSKELEEGFQLVQADLAAYLTQGGSLSPIKALFDRQDVAAEPHYFGELKRVDVTGDGIPETFIWMALPLSNESPWSYGHDAILGRPMQSTHLFIYTCENGEYVAVQGFILPGYEDEIQVMPTIYDFNRDGINEFIQPNYYIPPMFVPGYDLTIWGWDGEQLRRLSIDELEGDFPFSPFYSETWVFRDQVSTRAGSFDLLDVDNNGTTEILVYGYFGFPDCFVLYRPTRIVLMWNGHGLSSFYQRTPPVYRIQAVWDGDHMASRGYLEEALTFFEQSVDDDTLLTWSPEYLDMSMCSDEPTPAPETVVLDEGERDRLTAYSLYRMMWLHADMGNLEAAQAQYERLVTNYGRSIYVQLGTAFWEAYQISGNFDQAHQAAVAFTAEHGAEVCDPLTDIYDDEYSQIKQFYTQHEDVCPLTLIQ